MQKLIEAAKLYKEQGFSVYYADACMISTFQAKYGVSKITKAISLVY